MSELSPEAQSLVERERSAVNPRADDRARLRAKLSATLGAGAFAGATLIASSVEGAAPVAKAYAGGASLAAKLGLALALLGAVSGVTWFAVHERGRPTTTTTAPRATAAAEMAPHAAPASPPPLAPAPAPRVAKAAETVAPAQPARPANRPRRAPLAEPQPATTDAPVPADGDALGRELALLGRAQAALRTGDARAALALTDEHARDFAQGAMRVERLGIAALAHCTLGERDAREVAEFRALGAGSPLSARVASACGAP